MLAASKPFSKNTVVAPFKICRRLALSSSVTRDGRASSAWMVITARPKVICSTKNIGANRPQRNDRTVRSILTYACKGHTSDRTVRSIGRHKLLELGPRMSAKPERSEAHSHLNLVTEAAAADSAIPAGRAPMPAPRSPGPDVSTRGPAVAKQGSRRRRLILGGAFLLGLGVAGWYGEYWWTVGRFTVSTDDAYVYAHNTTIAAKVPGYLATIQVADNNRVRAGDVIATIDDGDYRLAAESAHGKVASQEATVARIDRQIVASRAGVEQAQAQIASAEAGRVRAEAELTRQQALAAKDFASHQALETAQANRDQARAAVTGAQAALAAAQANVEVMQAQELEAQRTL